jgi:hypothetical protein
LKKKLKIKSRATANPDFQERCIFGGFGTWSNFDVGEHFYQKKLGKVKILTFEGEV